MKAVSPDGPCLGGTEPSLRIGELDVTIRAMLANYPNLSKQFIAEVPACELVQLFRKLPARREALPPALDVGDIDISTRHGPVRVRVYRPTNAASAPPALINIHGGGWVGGMIEMDDFRCATLALSVGCVVFSVDYGLAPEVRAPVALDQCEDVFVAVASGAAGIEIDGGRVALCGSSAGGCLAVGVALRLQTAGNAASAMVLTYPVTDRRQDYPSYKAFSEGFVLTPAIMEWFWSQYAPNGDLAPPELVPMRITDLSGFPPSLIVTAEFDVLRDEAEAFAARLSRAGVATQSHRVPGIIHGFLSAAPQHPKSQQTFDLIGRFLRDAFGSAPAETLS